MQMKRLVMMVVAAGVAVVAEAMPTKANLQKAKELIDDVTAADVKALKAGTKKPAEVAAGLAQPGTVWLALGLVVVSTVLPYIFYTKGLAGLDSGKAAILASIEPVTAALVGVLAFGEPMSVSVILGLVCILISVYILR